MQLVVVHWEAARLSCRERSAFAGARASGASWMLLVQLNLCIVMVWPEGMVIGEDSIICLLSHLLALPVIHRWSQHVSSNKTRRKKKDITQSNARCGRKDEEKEFRIHVCECRGRLAKTANFNCFGYAPSTKHLYTFARHPVQPIHLGPQARWSMNVNS